MAGKERKKQHESPIEKLLTFAQTMDPGVYRLGTILPRHISITRPAGTRGITAVLEIIDPPIQLLESGESGRLSQRLTVSKEPKSAVLAAETQQIIWEKAEGLAIELNPAEPDSAPVDLNRYLDALSACTDENRIAESRSETDIGEPVKIGQYLSARINTFFTQEGIFLKPIEESVPEQQLVTFALGQTFEENHDGIVKFDRGEAGEVAYETVDLRQPPPALLAETRRTIGEHHVTVSQYRGGISLDRIFFEFGDGGRRGFVIEHPSDILQEIDLQHVEEGQARSYASPTDCIKVVQALDAVIGDQETSRGFSSNAPVDPDLQ